MTTRIIKTTEDIDALAVVLRARQMPMTVNIRQGVHRTTAQNRLQRKWMIEAAEQFGDRTPDDVRALCKLTIGIPILRQDDADFAAKYDRVVKPLAVEAKLALMIEPFDFPVTRLMTTKQKTTYLDRVHALLSEQGIVLTIPESER